MDIENLARIKRNVSKMVSQGAAIQDVDRYISGEGVSIDQIKGLPNQAVDAPEWSGSILPVSRYPDGRHEFDSDAGILGPVKRAFQLPGQVLRGEVPMSDPYTGRTSEDVIGRSAEMAATVAPAGAASRVQGGVFNRGVKTIPDTPTANELKAAGKGGFNAMRETGAEYKADDVARMANEAMLNMNKDGFNDVTAPDTFRTLNDLANPPAGSTATIDGMHSARKVFGKLGQKFTDPTEQSAAAIAKGKLDDFIGGAGQSVNGPPTMDVKKRLAAQLLKDANANYSAGKRSDLVGGIDKSAGQRASAANSGKNIGNAIRSKVASALEAPKKISGFNEAERGALEGVVHGTKAANATRNIGNYLGGGGGLGMLSSSAIGGGTGAALTAGSPIGAAIGATVPPLAGNAAKHISNAITKRALNKADDSIRQRSPLYEEMKRQAPVVGKGPTKKRAVAQAMMAREMEAREAQQKRFEAALRNGSGA